MHHTIFQDNDIMSLNEKIYIPLYPLNQFINAIWIGKVDDFNFQENKRALLLTELIFNYGDTFCLNGENILKSDFSFAQHTLSGLKTSPFKLKINGKYSNIGLVLKPYCFGLLYDLFGTNSMAAIAEICFEHLIIPDIPNFEAIEKHLCKIFLRKELDKDLINFENYISAELLRKGIMSDFNALIAVSQKNFIEKFKKFYLLTPNQFIKLKQVNFAVQLLENKVSSLTNIGLEAGFYDQAHFIKVFKQYCGATPGKFFKTEINFKK